LRTEDLALVILAGGRGERLGGIIKPLLRTEDGAGKTVLEVLEEAFAPKVARVYLVAPRSFGPELAKVSASELVEDRGRGPGEAVLDAARRVAEAWLFVVAGDQPRPSVRLFERLLARAKEATEAVAVADRGFRSPTFALYRRDALLAITRFGGERGISLADVLDALEVEEIPKRELAEDELRALEDADTPEQAAALGLALTPKARE
jgi:molybdopterin-guanine dinucleotide biosynthesis protein A